MTTAAKQVRETAARLSRLLPSGSTAPSQAARAPFVLLVVLLLGGGLITLLLLNSSLNEGSFKLSELKKRTTELTDQEQALQQDVDDRSAPGALERKARELGMVPGGSPAFLNPDGTVRGAPSEASNSAATDGDGAAPLGLPATGAAAPALVPTAPAPSAPEPPPAVLTPSAPAPAAPAEDPARAGASAPVPASAPASAPAFAPPPAPAQGSPSAMPSPTPGR